MLQQVLSIRNDVQVTIDTAKIEEDARWDGWKVYLTNTTLSPKDCTSQFHVLWVVERAFRILKGALNMRPIFCFIKKRIEAQVCECFVTLKVYKELVRLRKSCNVRLCVNEVIKIAKTISSVTIQVGNDHRMTKTLYLTPEQKGLIPIFDTLGL